MRKNRFYGRKKQDFLYRIITVLFIVLMFAVSIQVGTVGGDFIFSMQNGLIQDIDTEYFKNIINDEIPLINIVYDSGKIHSLSIELGNITRSLFGFDFSSPVSILNSQSSIFSHYYGNHYIKQMAEKDMRIDEKVIPKNQNKNGKENSPIGEGQYKKGESSIFYEGESEEKEYDKSDIISTDGIKIHNETNKKIDVEKLLAKPMDLEFDRMGPGILIYHTHTTESYIKSLNDLEKNVPSRSKDERHNVVRVGNELARLLEKEYGIEVLHSGHVNDYPNYNKSYPNAKNMLDKYLKSYHSIKLAIDIHRDAVSGSQKLRVVKEVGGKTLARVMFVVATGAPQWEDNLKLAIKLQQDLNKQCPGLAKHIYISKNRYNQHMAKASLLIEVGGDGNMVEECLESVKYVAKAINNVIKK